MKIGLIGLGNMGTAMLTGILAKGIAAPADIMGADTYPPAVEKAVRAFGIRTASDNQTSAASAAGQPLKAAPIRHTDNQTVAAFADLLILAVKPQIMAEVIEDLAAALPPATVVISIAAGKTLTWLSEHFSRPVKLVRVMPNTPALVGEAISGVCRNDQVTDTEMETCLTLLKSFGQAEEVPEYLMDAVVGVGGSAPGYVFLFIEALADGAVAAGMPRAQALRFAAQSVLGSAKMVLETGKHPGELKDMVCSPGGTTIEAIRVLEEKGMRGAIMAAVAACVNKSKTL